ncbi:MAG: response regulator transcription factor [Tissierellia bacterium]|nr:response regulator transcription factor [Tissierellia bacterium]
MRATVLVVDDDKEIARAICLLLEKEGYDTIAAYNGMEALDIAMNQEVHLMILDLMMPVMDGMSALMKLRKKKNIPVLILSAKTQDHDKIDGLSAGADDYITKPYNPRELVARVKSHLRRFFWLGDHVHNPSAEEIRQGGLLLNANKRSLHVDGEPVRITQKEFGILSLLMRSPSKVFTSDEIYRAVWNSEPYNVENLIMVHISRLRVKIEINPREPQYIKVVWGVGYKFEDQE